jgi:ribose-phosphate pyrophosphokinase
MVQPFSVLSTRSCVPYAKRVVKSMNDIPERRLFPDVIDYTDALAVMRFADGELEVTLNRSVRGRLVVLFATCARNEAGLSVEECKMELYHTIDVLKRSQAKEILVFEPYVSCSRSDRTTRRNSVGFWIHYKTLTSLGCNHLIAYQMHSDKSKTIVDPCLCSFDDVPAISILQKYLCDTTIRMAATLNAEVRDGWLFCSVDAGGEKLAKRFSSAFGTQLVIAHKQRNYSRPNEVESINLLSAVPLKGKTVWIVDDMIDTAGSVFNLVRVLKTASGTAINIMIVHPVLSGPAIGRLSELKAEGSLGRLVVCDTVACGASLAELPFIEVIDSAQMSARIVLTIIQDMPMSDLCDAFSPESYLQAK